MEWVFWCCFAWFGGSVLCGVRLGGWMAGRGWVVSVVVREVFFRLCTGFSKLESFFCKNKKKQNNKNNKNSQYSKKRTNIF